MAHSPQDGPGGDVEVRAGEREMPPANDVSNTRLYLGNLPRNATKADVENHFNTHGTGEITEIKLMNGFGFIEYKDALDARDVVPDGSDFMGERLVVQFARGSTRQRDGHDFAPRQAPRPRRTIHRMTITGLPFETSWQDLKDFARQSGTDVVYSEVNSRDRGPDGSGKGYVEYETNEDLQAAVEKLDNHDFKGSTVRCISDVSVTSQVTALTGLITLSAPYYPPYTPSAPSVHYPPSALTGPITLTGPIALTSPIALAAPASVTPSTAPTAPTSILISKQPQSEIPRPREQRFRSRSPGHRGGRGYGPPQDYDYHYDRRGPPRGYSPRRDDYRRRTPPPRDYYDDPRDSRYGPPRRGPPPVDDYAPPPRGRYPDDRYGGPPPPARGYDDPYANGHGREPYGGRPPSPRRDGRGYDRGYEPRPYW